MRNAASRMLYIMVLLFHHIKVLSRAEGLRGNLSETRNVS